METRPVRRLCKVSNADSNLIFRRSRRPLPSRPNLDVLGRISQINQIFRSSRQEEPGAGGGGGDVINYPQHAGDSERIFAP